MNKNHTSEIKLTVELDENRVPERISWDAEDGGVYNEDAKAMLLSLWDPQQKNSVNIDLWTKDMEVNDMKRFIHQTIYMMSQTFYKATGDEKMTQTMKDFCDYFAEKMEIK